MAAAGEESLSSTQQEDTADPMIMHLAQDMFRKTADYLNGEFDSVYSTLTVFYSVYYCCSAIYLSLS